MQGFLAHPLTNKQTNSAAEQPPFENFRQQNGNKSVLSSPPSRYLTLPATLTQFLFHPYNRATSNQRSPLRASTHLRATEALDMLRLTSPRVNRNPWHIRFTNANVCQIWPMHMHDKWPSANVWRLNGLKGLKRRMLQCGPKFSLLLGAWGLLLFLGFNGQHRQTPRHQSLGLSKSNQLSQTILQLHVERLLHERKSQL